MIDEDTGEEPSCPYCGSTDDCPHLLAVLDKSFGQCEGGYCYERFDELSAPVEREFKVRLSKSGRPKRSKQWKDPYVQLLWEAVLDEDVPEDVDDLVLPSAAYLDLVIDLLVEADADWIDGSLVSGSGPGMESSMELLYAEDPKATFERAIQILEGRLGAGIGSCQEAP